MKGGDERSSGPRNVPGKIEQECLHKFAFPVRECDMIVHGRAQAQASPNWELTRNSRRSVPAMSCDRHLVCGDATSEALSPLCIPYGYFSGLHTEGKW